MRLLLSFLLTFLSIAVLSQTNTNTNTKNRQQFTYIEHMPECPYNFDHYIRQHSKLNSDPAVEPIHGKVLLRFLILETGHIDSICIIKSLYPSADSEAVRLIKNMPAWKPGRNEENKPIKVWYTLPVIFN